MKILKAGTPWWVGTKLICSKCACEMQLELDDRPQLVPGLEERGDVVICPTCHELVPIRKVGGAQAADILDDMSTTLRLKHSQPGAGEGE